MSTPTPGTSHADLVSAVQLATRRLNDAINQYETAVAERLAMHTTDLQTLGLLELGGPLTAGQLAEASGLTTGAVTGVVDRLERAGYVRREDDPEDRRRVVINLVPERHHDVDELYRPLVDVGAQLYERYSDDELAVVLDVADRLEPLVREQTGRLRDGSRRTERPPARTAPGELSAPIDGVTQATLRFPRGAGHLVIHGDPAISELFQGHFLSSVATARVDRGVVSVQYRKSPFGWRAKHGELRLQPSVAWHLEMQGGCTRFDADLSGLRVLGVSITGGVSHGTITLPPPSGAVPVRIAGGVNDLTVLRPPGTAASLRIRGGAVNIAFDGHRYGAVGGESQWATGADGADRYEIELTGGAKTVVVATT